MMKFNRGGFSWKRFLGITRVKQNIARKTGIPLTKSGRQRKLGKAISKGCLGDLILFVGLIGSLSLIYFLF